MQRSSQNAFHAVMVRSTVLRARAPDPPGRPAVRATASRRVRLRPRGTRGARRCRCRCRGTRPRARRCTRRGTPGSPRSSRRGRARARSAGARRRTRRRAVSRPSFDAGSCPVDSATVAPIAMHRRSRDLRDAALPACRHAAEAPTRIPRIADAGRRIPPARGLPLVCRGRVHGTHDGAISARRRFVLLLLTLAIVASNVTGGVATAVEPPDLAVQPADPAPAQLQQLVAPIALYPDELVAQVLAAATYPDQVVEADRWLEQHHDLQGDRLAREVDAQPWDPSVKALVQFPSVLANMDKNLSWTSALGDAYVNDQQNVMDAIQTMRRRAHDAGNLRTTSQQNVVEQGSQLAIESANPQVVYVPQYDPWLVYGPPLVAWPGWYAYPGLFIAEPGIAFCIGSGIGFFGCFGWVWGHWGCDWGHRTVVFNDNIYVSRSRTFANRRTFAREPADVGRGARGFGASRGAGAGHPTGGFARGGGNHTLGSYHGPGGSHPTAGFGGGGMHGFAAPGSAPEGRWGAFSGFDHGGTTRGLSQRGFSSSGGFHGGGSHGGPHGGGGHR